MLLPVLRVELGHPYRDLMFAVSQPWNHLAATGGRQAPQADPVKEATVPRTALTVQHRPSRRLLDLPLIFRLLHIRKIHKENVEGGHQVLTEVLQTQMVPDK